MCLTPGGRSGLGVVVLPAFVAALRGARLAGWPPRPPDSASPARTGRHPAAGLGSPLGRRRRGDLGRAVVPTGWPPGCSDPAAGQPEGAVRRQAAHPHCPGLAVSTIHGDLPWVDGGWPGSCHEHELTKLSGLDGALDGVEVVSLLDRGFRGLAKTREHWHTPAGDRRTRDRPTHRWAAGAQPSSGGAARAGGAVGCPSGQRVGAAPLAGAAVPSPGRLPGRWCTDLSSPLAPPGARRTKPITTPQSRSSAGSRVWRSRARQALRSGSNAPKSVPKSQ